MLEITKDIATIGIVGAGLMGRGIAQIAAQGGLQVWLHDSRREAAEEARRAIIQTLQKLVDKGKLGADEATLAGERIAVAGELPELAPCDVVVEAIVENLEIKQTLFRQIEAVVRDDCILATNTSSLSVTALASACRLPERFAGFHFFSPVPLMKIVEVIDGLLSDPRVGDALIVLAQRMGHTPVRAKDTPGFIVNHAGRGYLTESLRVLGEGIAEFSAVDDILRSGGGFRMGPFELLDLTGLDVSLPVMESIYNLYYQEPRYRPSPLLRQRLSGGVLGRKTGRGFYTYANGEKCPVPKPAVPAAAAMPVWISRTNPGAAVRLAQILATPGLTIDHGPRPDPASLCIVLPVGQDATTQALAEELDPERTVAVDPWSLEKHLTLMTTPVTSREIRNVAWAALAGSGLPVTVIHDSPGFVIQRVLAMVVNIGCDIAQQGIASPQDIDRAVTLGLGYPKGPLAMGDALGARNVLAVLESLGDFYQDPRYRPSPWLIRRARLGVSLLTIED